MKSVFIVVLVLAIFPISAMGQDNVASQISELRRNINSIELRLDDLKNDLRKMQDSSYTTLLEKNVEVLQVTNNALVQRWTPMNLLLSGLASIFAVITIALGFIFAFGYQTYRGIKKYKGEIITERKNLKKNSQELMASISQGGDELLKHLKEKKSNAAQIEKEIEDFKEQAKTAIERLEDKAFVAVASPAGTASVLDRFDPFAPIDNESVKTCSNCGVLFKEKNSDSFRLRSVYEPVEIYSRPEVSLGGFRGGFRDNKVLCPRCRGKVGETHY